MCPDVSACSLTNEVFKDKENAIYRSVGVWMDDPMQVILPVVVARTSECDGEFDQIPASKTRYAVGIFLPEGQFGDSEMLV